MASADWIFDTDSLNLIDVDMENNRKRWLKLKLNRPKIEIIVYEIFGDAKIAYWNRFKNTTISMRFEQSKSVLGC